MATDDYAEKAELGEETQTIAFAGHDSDFEADLRWTAPEMAGAHMLAAASAGGSAQARRRARFLVAILFGVPFFLSLAIILINLIR